MNYFIFALIAVSSFAYFSNVPKLVLAYAKKGGK